MQLYFHPLLHLHCTVRSTEITLPFPWLSGSFPGDSLRECFLPCPLCYTGIVLKHKLHFAYMYSKLFKCCSINYGNVMPHLQPFFTERVFQIFDKDNSGSISLQEFIDAMHQFAGQSPDDKIRFLFKVYDLDGKICSHLVLLYIVFNDWRLLAYSW